MKKMISVMILSTVSSITTKTTTAAGVSTKAKSNGFLSSLVRFNMVGTINEQLTYRMRYRFNKEGTPTTRDDSTTALDHLYIDHKNSVFTTRFGKTSWAEAFGRESFISSTDLYLTSDSAKAYKDNIGEYRFGAGATFTFAETNKLTLAVSNPNNAVTDTAGETKNNSLAYGVHYSSVLLNKAFQPLLSYTLAAQDPDAQGTNTQKADYTMMAAGFRSEAVENLIIDADWKQFEREKKTVTAVAADGKTSSIFANVSYNINEFSPFVQYVNDKFKGELATLNADYKKNSFAVGTGWKPFADVNFRYHILYTNSNKKFDSASAANSKITDNKITFGIKADI
jgi:hypothetical protein